MAAVGPTESLPEANLNDLLRQVDWRFLLDNPDRPRALDLGSGIDPRALELIVDPPGEDRPTLVLAGAPRSARLEKAAQELAPGGEIVCVWRMPRPGGPARAKRHLEAAGFVEPRVYWPGPMPFKAPQFWLPAGSGPARRRLLASRPARNRWQAALRTLWSLAERLGLLAPAYALARLPDFGAETSTPTNREDPILLTGGRSSINKVVALTITTGQSRPDQITKFARVAAADDSLDREARALNHVAEHHPGATGIPRLLDTETRAGRRALTETAIAGEPVIAGLNVAGLSELADRVGDLLTDLAASAPAPPEQWRERLVEQPLRVFERDFGAVAAATATRSRTVLAKLGPLPPTTEHRDCSPWNVVEAEHGLGLLDWESAEPDGLPVLDLVYFIANAALVLDGALESGEGRPTYRRLLDPNHPYGRVFQRSLPDYCARLSVPPAQLRPLRLLCWIVHARSDARHLTMAAAGPPSAEALRSSMFLALIEEELAHGEEKRQA